MDCYRAADDRELRGCDAGQAPAMTRERSFRMARKAPVELMRGSFGKGNKELSW